MKYIQAVIKDYSYSSAPGAVQDIALHCEAGSRFILYPLDEQVLEQMEESQMVALPHTPELLELLHPEQEGYIQ